MVRLPRERSHSHRRRVVAKKRNSTFRRLSVEILESRDLLTVLPAGFTETQVGTVNSPTTISLAPDGRLFVAEQAGNVRVIQNDVVLNQPFLTIPVDDFSERGLLGIAFDPAFATNQYLYVYYTTASGPTHNRISRFTANGNVAVAGSEQIIFELDSLSAGNHNGGAIHFGADGKLYVAVGDNAVSANSQSLNNLHGKMLRINSDGTIPSDNPFFDVAVGKNRAIWAMGLRNPFNFAVQPGTGRVFVNDVGQGSWEEINDVIVGANYGWPAEEGVGNNPSFEDPLYAYPHSGPEPSGCAIVGGSFYNPDVDQFGAEYLGDYFFADYCDDWIYRYDASSDTVTAFADLQRPGFAGTVDVKVHADGSVYYTGTHGGVFKIKNPNGQIAPTITNQPSGLTVPEGAPAAFHVTATGSLPLAYQWQRDGIDIPGATADSYTLSSATPADDNAAFRVIVHNSAGSVISSQATLTVTSNQAPAATITAPALGTTWNGGDTVNYAGAGADLEDGNLPASAFTWRVDFHHDDHVHPFLPSSTGITGGSFAIPTLTHDVNVWYRIHLTVEDSLGLTHSTFRDVHPNLVPVTFQSNVVGLELTLDGQPFVSPRNGNQIVGIEHSLAATSPQSFHGITYHFVAWSDGGASTHDIIIPAADTTYTATFYGVDSDTVHIYGTDAADDFTFSAGATHNVSVNGHALTFEDSIVAEFNFHGLGGSDTIAITGTSGDEQIDLRPGSSDITGTTYRVHVSDVEAINVHGGGGPNDRANIFDSPGNDRLVARPDWARLTGTGFELYVSDFDRVFVYAAAGGSDDRAYLYDAPGNDKFYGRPDYGLLRGSNFEFYNYTHGFDRVYAYATAGGSLDQAYLYDSSANDRFYGTTDYGLLRGGGYEFYNYANGFDSVYAYATAVGADDRAYLYDSPDDDTLAGRPQWSRLTAGDGQFNHAEGFGRVYAYATSGGSNDRAYLYDSTGNDRFTGRPAWSQMSGGGFLNHASGFDRVLAHATTGDDRAYLYDSQGNDRFYGRSNYSLLRGGNFEFYNYASGFDRAYAYANAGGSDDRAYLYDSATDDRFFGKPNYGLLRGSGFEFYNYASGFGRVYAYATAGGSDRADVYDSTGNDEFYGRRDIGRLSGSGFFNYVSRFTDVHAYSTQGGVDTLDVAAIDYALQSIGDWL